MFVRIKSNTGSPLARFFDGSVAGVLDEGEDFLLVDIMDAVAPPNPVRIDRRDTVPEPDLVNPEKVDGGD